MLARNRPSGRSLTESARPRGFDCPAISGCSGRKPPAQCKHSEPPSGLLDSCHARRGPPEDVEREAAHPIPGACGSAPPRYQIAGPVIDLSHTVLSPLAIFAALRPSNSQCSESARSAHTARHSGFSPSERAPPATASRSQAPRRNCNSGHASGTRSEDQEILKSRSALWIARFTATEPERGAYRATIYRFASDADQSANRESSIAFYCTERSFRVVSSMFVESLGVNTRCPCRGDSAAPLRDPGKATVETDRRDMNPDHAGPR